MFIGNKMISYIAFNNWWASSVEKLLLRRITLFMQYASVKFGVLQRFGIFNVCAFYMKF